MKANKFYPYLGCLILLWVGFRTELLAQPKAVPLPNAINTEYDELMPRLSPDGNTLYFARANHPENVGGRGGGQDIWFSTRDAAGNWTAARNLGAGLNNAQHNFVGAALDGDRLLLGNIYGSDATAGPGVSLSMRMSGNWSEPVTVIRPDMLSPNSQYVDFHAPPNGKVLILSRLREDSEFEDLAVSFLLPDRTYSTPVSLGDDINTADGYEIAPFLAADGRTLYFTSNGHGGQGGADIFRTERLDESWQAWSKPENLGPSINTAGFDGHWAMDPKGEWGFFTSGPTPSALGDIYTVDMRGARPATAARLDTVDIYTSLGQATSLDAAAMGLSGQQIRLATARTIDGHGRIALNDAKDQLVYFPAFMFKGTELLKVTVCDPPLSDACRHIMVRAHVGAEPTAVVGNLDMRTPKNVELPVSISANDLSLAETQRRYNQKSGPKGKLLASKRPDAAFIYQPPRDFVGRDTVGIYGACPNGETSNCLRMELVITVTETGAATLAAHSPKGKDPKNDPDVTSPKTDLPKTTTPGKLVTLSGIVRDDSTRKGIPARLTFFTDGNAVTEITCSADGRYEVQLPPSTQYTVTVQESFYQTLTEGITTDGKAKIKGSMTKDFDLKPLPVLQGEVIVLQHILFDTDLARIKAESKPDLMRLYAFMRANPTVQIEVAGHTDDVGSEAHNQVLSEKRAQMVVNYLKYLGIMGDRMTVVGHGEIHPVETNATEWGRAQNRRVEFMVVKR